MRIFFFKLEKEIIEIAPVYFIAKQGRAFILNCVRRFFTKL